MTISSMFRLSSPQLDLNTTLYRHNFDRIKVRNPDVVVHGMVYWWQDTGTQLPSLPVPSLLSSFFLLLCANLLMLLPLFTVTQPSLQQKKPSKSSTPQVGTARSPGISLPNVPLVYQIMRSGIEVSGIGLRGIPSTFYVPFSDPPLSPFFDENLQLRLTLTCYVQPTPRIQSGDSPI